MYRRSLAPGLALLLAACAQSPAVTDNTVRICDDTGCSNHSKYDLSYQKKGDTEDLEDPRIAALKQTAKTQPRAAYDLGLRYFRGDGVHQDSYQGLKWMREAAERGDLNAQKALGGFYLFGLEEMGSDAREAEKWLSIAVARGDKESKNLLDLARRAKKEDEEDWKWLTHWRDVYYGYWHSVYPYYGVWQQQHWYY